MEQICTRCSAQFQVSPEDIEFYKKVSPVIAGVTYEIPPPTLCTDCRKWRRMTFRNERSLYTRPCDSCKKNMLSIYSPDKPYVVNCSTCFWDDKNDATAVGRDFDFNRTFFEQFKDLWMTAPLLTLWATKMENADYNNNCFGLKDSYMNVNTDRGENNYYSYVGEYCNDIVDCSFIRNSELCYESTDLKNCYHCLYSQSLENSRDCYFSTELIGCSNCFGCHGLRHKENHIFNKQVSKEEWQTFMKELVLTPESISQIKAQSNDLRKTLPQRHAKFVQCENVTGDNLYNCKNAVNCFDATDGEGIKNVMYGAFPIRFLQDAYAAGEVQWTYELLGGAATDHCAFIINPANGLNDSYYTVLCLNGSKNLFGCVGLKKKEYCILNKQYSREEYEALVPRIIEHMKRSDAMSRAPQWGEFFPPQISPFGHNESLAQEHFPITKEQAIGEYLPWSDYQKSPLNVSVIKARDLPADIKEVGDDILEKAVECEVTGRPFRIIKQELDFYRSQGLPIPRRHPDQRYMDRNDLRRPRKLTSRMCDNCSTEIFTTYGADGARGPAQAEKIFCEKCYLEATY